MNQKRLMTWALTAASTRAYANLSVQFIMLGFRNFIIELMTAIRTIIHTFRAISSAATQSARSFMFTVGAVSKIPTLSP
jgi:hypothetical protein